MENKQNLQIINAAYVASAVRADQYPPEELPEIAFLGRSNVGKSSLINSLCNHRGLARVSGEPGKTQTINFYTAAIRQEQEDAVNRYPLFLVDLPGYGFAKTGKANRDFWSAFIGNYVQYSSRLALLCLLVDLRHPGLAIDEQAYTWLADHDVQLQIIGTKADKLKANERSRNLAMLNNLFPGKYPAVAYSALKNDGRDRLLQHILAVITEK